MGGGPDRSRTRASLRYLETAPHDPDLHQLVTLVAARFAFPVALLTVLDARRGPTIAVASVDVVHVDSETRHTIASVGAQLGSAPGWTALTDEVARTARPLVAGHLVDTGTGVPGMRAYVAAPLWDSTGTVVGTLCLVDTRPRTVTGQQLDELVSMAAVVQRQLERLRTSTRLGPSGVLTDAHELANAVVRGQVVPYYQPVVELSTGEAQAVETLARWVHPTRGVLVPGHFLGLAEDTELVIDLDLAVLGRAAVELAQWRGGYPGLRLSANISAKHFNHPDCVSRLTAAVASVGVPPSAVTLEMTEPALMAAHVGGTSYFAALHEQGFRVLLDAFGGGVGERSQLRSEDVLRLPVDGIKIDRAVCSQLGTRVGDAVVRGLVDLARGQDLHVVISGLETTEQAELAQQLGCTHGQGYLWAPPVPAADFAGLLVAP
ncbi:EAL domain-containing protein [Rhodococcus sp. X156]|uniref:EAL domain-containing protein n=1 Tax=Rhodococcus sp. X156 TaxID=2499145 RepID=UPI000FD8CE86|nr:EAL domain-containing protein [Rhodococcus sp. X156]